MMEHEIRLVPLDEAFANDFLERLRAIFNAHDLDAFVGLMAEDVVFEHRWAGTMRRLAEIRAFYERFWKAFPDLRVDPENGPFFHPHAPRITIIWLGTGTHTGPLDPPGLPPTGMRIQGHVWEMLEFRDGLLSRIGHPHRDPLNVRLWPDSEVPSGGPAGPLTKVDLPRRRSERHVSF
jgi:hypothetical protein